MSGRIVRHSYSARRRTKRKLWPIIVLVVLLIAVGAGTGTAVAKQKKLEKEYIAGHTPSGTEAPTAGPTDILPTPTPTAMLAAGAFGYWEPTNTPTPTMYVPEGVEVWMADWVDTRTPVDSKGIYVTSNYTSGDESSAQKQAWLDELLELVDRTELNTMVIDIKYESGAILYGFDSELMQEYGTIKNKMPFLPEYIEKLHEHGVYVVARIVSFKDSLLASKRPDLALYNKDGSYYKDNNSSYWLSPYKQEVWDYLVEVGKQCRSIGFDEVNFDYIRFPTDKVSNVDWGPEAETTTKVEAITKGVKYICEELRKVGLYVSADVYGIVIIGGQDSTSVGQDFVKLSQYLDYICPMVYPSHYDSTWANGDSPDKHPYEVVSKALAGAVNALKVIPEYLHCAKVRPWLQDFTADYLGSGKYLVYGTAEVGAEIQAVYDQGYSGWLLWNAKGVFTEGALKTKE